MSRNKGVSENGSESNPVPACFIPEHVSEDAFPTDIPRSPTPVLVNFGEVEKHIETGKLKEAKVVIRSQNWTVDHDNRGELWKLLCKFHSKERTVEGFYEEMIKEYLGLVWPMNIPTYADPIFCEDYYLNSNGQKKVERILYIISSSHPDITYSPIIYPIASLFLHYLPEDKTYYCICDLVDGSKVRHINTTRISHDTSARALLHLTRKITKKTFSQLEKMMDKSDVLEKSFDTWQLWIFRGLPFYYLVRAVDCFLMEGIKALYRIAMAILVLFCQETAKNPETYSDAGEFLDKIIVFCQGMPLSIDKFLKIAYSIRGVSTKLLNRQIIKSEMCVRALSSGRQRTASVGGMPMSNSLYHLQITSSCLTIKERKLDRNRSHSVGVVPLGNFKSSILTPEQMATIWNWVPTRITMMQPEVIYSTNEHGCSLTNFYFHTENWEPFVIVIKTVADEIFGAYCSTKLQDRSLSDEHGRRTTFFGTGETFLFTITPHPKKFTWVGTHSTTDVPHTSKMFIAADQKMISVGAGNGIGLYIGESMASGRTEHCETFDNPPLCPGKDFTIKVLEVIGFV